MTLYIQAELMTITQTILSNLIHNETYSRKVIPFIKLEYFTDHYEKVISQEIINFFDQYNSTITLDILAIQISNRSELRENQLQDIEKYINELTFKTDNEQWLYDNTEKFCKNRAVINAIIDAYDIVEGKNKDKTEDAIPSLLSDALAVSFDSSVGHDYLEDYQERYDFYHRVEEKIPFDLDIFNKITKGGLSKKTLNIILAGTAVGKSLFMCHVAASSLLQNKNVLYITMEMAEERIAERIDANLLNMNMNEMATIDLPTYNNRINKLIKKTSGKLIVKQYPTSTAHSGHFKALLEELKIKRNFKPDMIIIDYLNICCSSRIKNGSGVNSYTYVKSIAEELRGLAVEYDVPLLSATQTTRGGFGNTDVELTDTSESFGLPATADMMFALIATEELENLNQIMVKQLKNRYADPGYYKRFVIGVDRSRMKLYDVEESAQKDISESGQPATQFLTERNKKSQIETKGFTF
jgi:replicative DNA helicase